MTVSRGRDPAPELTTTRIGGGRKAWLVAVGAIVVLGGFVYVGLTGPAVPPNTPQPKPSTAVAIATSTARPTPNLDEVTSIRADPTAPLLYQYLGTGLILNGRGTLAVLDRVAPLQYRGQYRIPYALRAPSAELELDAVTASVSHDDLESIGSWTIPLTSMGNGEGPSIDVFHAGRSPQDKTLTNPEFFRLTMNGFAISVTLKGQPDATLMTIDVAVVPDEFVPNESFSINAGPPTTGLTVDLQRLDRGAYSGDIQLPAALHGETLAVTLVATPKTEPSSNPIVVGTWSIRLSSGTNVDGADQIEVHVEGQPVGYGASEIVGSGYDLYANQLVLRGHLYLMIILNITQPSRAPTP